APVSRKLGPMICRSLIGVQFDCYSAFGNRLLPHSPRALIPSRFIASLDKQVARIPTLITLNDPDCHADVLRQWLKIDPGLQLISRCFDARFSPRGIHCVAL